MIRCLVWRLRFEACNIKRLFGHGRERVHYLAFGANLSDDILKQRRIRPLASVYFTLRDHALRFDHPAAQSGCAYASAEHAPGELLHGSLLTLSGRDAARMDFYEVVPVIRRYRRTVVEQDGVELYFYQTNRSTPGLKPTALYLGYIVDGLESHPEVSPEYREQLRATETAEPGPLLPNYFGARPAKRPLWLARIADAYQRLATRLFQGFIYRFSLTEFLIRREVK